MSVPQRRIPGLMIERLPSGNVRYRVRPTANKNRKIMLPCGPEDPDFDRLYTLARAGHMGTHSAIEVLKKSGNLDKQASAMLGRARNRAKSKHWEFNLTKDDIISMLLGQECRCAVSGMKFDLKPEDAGSRRPRCPSIDRIDNSAGYVRGNVRLTCSIVNVALSDWGEDVFREMCEAVVRNN